MVLISKIAVQAYRTFCRGRSGSEQLFQQNLSKLRELMGRLTSRDLNFDEDLVRHQTPFDPDSGLAPVTFIEMWNDEHFSMSIFVLKPGTRLPMHDHPGMHGIIRVLHGHMTMFSYSLLERKSDTTVPLQRSGQRGTSVKKGDIFTAKRMSASTGDLVDTNSEPLVLTPVDGNVHEIRATDTAAAFFDILAPPYDDHRAGTHHCHYYKELPVSKSDPEPSSSTLDKELCNLICVPTPWDYWTDYAPYDGPDFNPYESTETT